LVKLGVNEVNNTQGSSQEWPQAQKNTQNALRNTKLSSEPQSVD